MIIICKTCLICNILWNIHLCGVATVHQLNGRADSRDLQTKFEDGQGRWTKTSDALYQTVINIDFRSSENATSSKQWYLQIDVLDVCMSVKHFIIRVIMTLWLTCKFLRYLRCLTVHSYTNTPITTHHPTQSCTDCWTMKSVHTWNVWVIKCLVY